MKRTLFTAFFLLAISASIRASAQSLPASPRCGDGQQSRGEICDDGNNQSGDGCAADCMSLEVCGDTHLDPKEQCDDGNTIAGDGCDARCMTEVALKLPEKAKRRALIGTLVSYPLMLLIAPQLQGTNVTAPASFLGLATGLAPSAGHFYTRAYGRGALTSAARYLLNSGTILSIAFFSALNRTTPLDQQNTANAVALTSCFLLPSIAISIWDISDAPRSISRMAKKGKYAKQAK